ncbi:hypothetical protein NQ317_009862 [Molorchus minor]|uniref:N-acetyllactosaminide beta-1,3-N-acetylglucosaminyltransferase n=1 Tax=Molorchus minor TaxID=1323400 RepID=A0ABQ9K2R8_9CUCU|nr:hypothetical protein NQ317_009862 [Molorchus minor]
MIPKLRSGYLCFFCGIAALILIFTLSSHRQGIIYNDISLLGGHVNSNSTNSRSDGNSSLLDIISCSDIILEKNVQQRGNFVVFQNYIRAEKQFRCDESITLTSPGDYRFLDNIIPLVERWRGPCIAFLRTCETPLIRELVTFHLFFENEHIPNTTDRPLIGIYRDAFDCSLKPPYAIMTDDEMYKEKHALTYPINVARNIAKVTAQTYFVFPSDIELYPTRNFIEHFMTFVHKNPEHFQEDKSNVFVLPIFEILADQKVPENKSHLQEMYKSKTAILFHKTVCPQCHKVPDGDKWIQAWETEGLNVFSVGKREGPHAIWEPFFVCTQREPLWDERLNWEGQGNKMCQAYTMCILDYDFMVFDNAFLIHKPGIKKKKVQVLKHMDQTRKNNKILVKIQNELQKIYGKTERCRVHNVF